MAQLSLKEQIRADQTRVLVLISPYHPALSARARNAGGTWHALSRTWRFDVRDATRVREICLDIYGLDPWNVEGAILVTVEVKADPEIFPGLTDSFWLLGRELAHQPSRDARPRLGEKVILKAGGFSGGGSMRYPRLNPEDGTVLEVRDVPLALVEQTQEGLAQRGHHDVITVVDMAPFPLKSGLYPPALGNGAMNQILALFDGLPEAAQRRVFRVLEERINRDPAGVAPVPIPGDGDGMNDRGC